MSFKQHIYIIGPSGVGKTTVGKAVAEKLSMEFVDLDEHISSKIEQPISKYFDEHGEDSFREVESESLQEISELDKPCVVSCGGGTPLKSKNIVLMKNTGTVFYLSALETDIIERIKSDSTNDRPLLKDDLESKVREQAISRKEIYELAQDIEIATSRRDIDTVAEAIIRQYSNLTGQNINLNSAIVVGNNLYPKISEYIGTYNKYVLISDAGVPHKYKEEIIASIGTDKVLYVEISQGETGKSFDSYQRVIAEMAKNQITRNSCVIALGGGVVGDLSGFVASSYHRGIDVIQVPTTLLAQVDSSIGGKCGINLDEGKNLVGAFHQPKTIIADISSLETLSEQDFLSGLGEIAKYALLGNKDVEKLLTENIDEIKNRNQEFLMPLIKSAMNHKVFVVSRDPHERTGIRATLNLGHTLAHTLETISDYKIPHGMAVLIGLKFVAELSHKLGRINKEQLDRTLSFIEKLEIETNTYHEFQNTQEIISLMYSDKKSLGSLSFILFNSDGTSELVHGVDKSVVKETLDSFF